MWLTLQIGAVLLGSVNTILDKRLVRDYAPNPVIYLLSFALVGMPLVAIGVWYIPWPGWTAVITGIIVGLLFTGMVLLHYKAMSLEDVSRFAPISRLSGILQLALLAFFWGDQLSAEQYGASGLMVLGAVVLGYRRGQGRGRFQLSRGMVVMVVFVMITAVQGAVGSQLNLNHSPWVLQLWSNVGIILGTGLVLLLPTQRRVLWQELSNTPNRFRVIIMGEQSGRLLTSILSDIAVSTAGSAAIVSTFSGLRPLFILIMAAYFLNERLSRAKLLGVGLIVLGTAVLLGGI